MNLLILVKYAPAIASSNVNCKPFDVIRGNGYFEASELCPQFEKNLFACFLITLEQSNKNL